MVWLLSIAVVLLAGLDGADRDLRAARNAMDAKNWRRAVAILTDHLEHAPDDNEAYYLRGICYGEIGKSPNLRNRLERVLQKSVADFQTVVARDSLFRDVVFQLAMVRRYGNDFQEAIRLGEWQLRLRPDLVHVHLGLMNFYWRYVVSTVPAEARLWLRAQPGQYARLFVGKTYEQQRLYRAASKVYEALLEEEALTVPVSIALARLHFARQDPVDGTRYMNQAIEGIRTDLEALMLFDEIRTIVAPDEQAAFERLGSAEESKRFFSEFWIRRDPMPAAPFNARLAEHYRRLRVAETHYVFHGYRNWFRSRYTHDEAYFPPTYVLSHDYDDRGIMFIRHGEPDDLTMSETPTWLFNASEEQQDPRLIFHFAPTCDRGVCGVTKHFSPTPRGESFLPPRWIGLDLQDVERKTQAYITQGLSTDRHRWPPETMQLDMPFLLASFRGMDGRTRVEAYFEVPLKAMMTVADTLVFEAGFMVHDEQWRQHALNRNVVRLPAVDGGRSYAGFFQADLRPQPYQVAMHVRSLQQQALRAHTVEYVPLDFVAQPGPKLSDILLADSITVMEKEGVTKRGDVFVHVRPSGYFEHPATPAVYFEIYDLAISADGRTRYAVSYSIADQRGGVTSLSTDEFEGSLHSPIEFVSIDVAGLRQGTYELSITVEDRVSGTAVSRSRQLLLGR